MQVSENELRKIVEAVVLGLSNDGQAAAATPAKSQSASIQLGADLVEVGEALPGKQKDEVVIGLAPAFMLTQKETICNLPHDRVLREIVAGIEEEGLKARFVKVYNTSDVSFIGLIAAKLSGSGIGIGLQSKGTAIIHQKNLAPLNNLELFPQSPLLDYEVYRAIGKNAGKYAKGEPTNPIPTRNDQMCRPKYQGTAAVLHIKETEHVDRHKKTQECEFRVTR